MKSNKGYVLGTSLLVTLVAVICKVLGFVREMSIASVFGTSSHMDAYVVALSIPSLLIATIAAAIGTVVIPQFIRKQVKDGQEAAMNLAGTIWNVLIVFAVLIIIICELLMPYIIRIVAPGFSGEVFNETVYLARILMPMALFLCLLPTARGILNSLQRYLLTTSTELILNICVIFTAIFLARLYGIKTLAFATLIGLGIQLVILWPALRRHGFRSGLRIDWRLPELGTIVRLSIPVAIGSGLTSINLFINRIMASGLEVGTVASLNYAHLIYTMPMVFIGPAVTIVLYTVLADMFARQDMKRVVYSVRQALSLFAYIVFPIAAGMFLLAVPLVQIIYQRGAFQAEAVGITAAIMAMYVLGLPAYAWREVCSRAFFAAGNTLTPLYTGILAIGVNIVLIFVLVKVLFAPGLALATVIASWVGAISIMWFWNKEQKKNAGSIDDSTFDRKFWVELGKVLLATLIMALAVGQLWSWLQVPLTAALSGVAPGSGLFTLIHLKYFAYAVLCGVVVYVPCTLLLKSENAAYLWQAIQQMGAKLGKG